MRRFLVLTRMLTLMTIRERETVFWLFIFPVGLLLILGAANGGDSGAVVAAWLMAGVLVMNIMSASLGGDATWLANMRDRGVLVRLRVAPLPVTELVIAYGLVRMALIILQSVLIVVVAMLAFGVRPRWESVPAALLVTLVGGAVFLLLGQALAAVVPSASAANVLSNILYFPILFLSNLVMPIALFPGWLEAIAQWSPAALLVDLLRPILTSEQAMHAAVINLGGLLLYGLAGLVIIARWFRWESRV